MRKIYREIYFRGSREQLRYLVDHLPKYANEKWVHRVDTDILSNYLLFRYLDHGSNAIAEVSIYYGDDNLNQGELRVGNIVPLNKDVLSVEEYNEMLMLFYSDVVAPYKSDNGIPFITEPSTDTFDLHQVMSDESYGILVRFIRLINKEGKGDYLNSLEEPLWHDFVYHTYEDGRELGEEDLLYAFLDEDFLRDIGSEKMDTERAEKLVHRYEIEFKMLEYYGKLVDDSLKWGTF